MSHRTSGCGSSRSLRVSGCSTNESRLAATSGLLLASPGRSSLRCPHGGTDQRTHRSTRSSRRRLLESRGGCSRRPTAARCGRADWHARHGPNAAASKGSCVAPQKERYCHPWLGPQFRGRVFQPEAKPSLFVSPDQIRTSATPSVWSYLVQLAPIRRMWVDGAEVNLSASTWGLVPESIARESLV